MRRAPRLTTIGLVGALALVLSLLLLQIVRAGERYTVLPNLEVDAREYHAIAVNLSKHPSLDAFPPVFPPGFVAIVALVYFAVGPSLVAAKVVLWFCLVLATVLAAVLARRIHGTAAAGWTAAVLTATSPALQAYTTTLQHEVLVAALILLLTLLGLSAGGPPRPSAVCWRALLLGAALGLSVLVREPLIALIPVFAAFAAHQVTRTARLRTGLGVGVLVLAVSMLFATSWSVYQSGRAGRPMLIRDNVQGILPVGHNPYANGTWNVALQGVGEPAGLAFIISEPRRELWLLGRKFLYFWGVLRDGWNVPRRAAVWLARATGGLLPLDVILPAARGGWLLVALIVAGAALRAQQWRDFWLLPATIVALMAVHLVTIASHRFAVPILPVVFVLIAGTLARAIAGLRRAHWLGIAIVLALAVAMQWGRWPLRYTLAATELDGVESENRLEPDGRRVRFSNAAGGRRVAFALYDEYLPGGSLVLRVDARRGPTPRSAATPVARIRLFLLDGTSTSCATDVTVGQLPVVDRWTPLRVSCTLPHDGVARLIVETFGRVDLSFSEVRLQWLRRATATGAP